MPVTFKQSGEFIVAMQLLEIHRISRELGVGPSQR